MFRDKFLVVLALLLCAQPAAADNPKKVAIGPGSAKGALVFRAAPSTIGYALFFTRDEGKGAWSRGYWVVVEGSRAGESDRFIVETFPPGRYRLNAVYQQGKWAACLHATTFTVTVTPGNIAYLGMLDARPTLASIQRNARAKNELNALTFQWHLYRTNVVAPGLSGRDPESVADAGNFVRQHMPKSSATMTLADVQWGPYASSETGRRPNEC